MRAALIKWDLPEVVRMIHRKLGWSQLTLAAATGYSQMHMSRWINGQGQPGSMTLKRLLAFADGLGIPLGLMGLTNENIGESSDPRVSGNLADEIVIEREGDDVRRRTFFFGAPAAIGLSALGSGAAALLATESGTSLAEKLGRPHVKQLRLLSNYLISQDYQHGGYALFTQAATQFEVAQEQLNCGNFESRVEQGLFSAVGELAGCAGWLAYDAGCHRDARYYFGEALLAARLAGDQVLTARTYRQMSVQANEIGRFRESLHLARAATRAAKGWAPPRMRSLLIATEARALASMGDLAAAQRLVNEAKTVFDQHNGEELDVWFNFFDRNELSGTEGLCLLNAGNSGYPEKYSAAETRLRVAADRGLEYQRNNALYTARVGLAQLGQTNIVDAAQSGEEAMAMLSDGIYSNRIAKTLRVLDRGLSKYERVPAVRSFREHFVQATRTAEGNR